jgi:NADPH:quinone reductase-like Zn-dependent oxidoreductase
MKGRMEHRFPLVPGMDASGTVEAIGDGVTEWSVGDDVFGSVGKMYLGEGTLAEFTTMSAATIARKPLSIEHADAASVPVAGITALIMADAVSIAEGPVVVVIGATGGVGSYFVQISASRGAHVVAVCSTDNVAYARKLGAADVIDYTSDDVVDAVAARYPDGINAVADIRGDTDAMGRLAEKIRKGGHVASAVGSADVEALARRDIGATNVQGIVTTASLQTFVGLLERKDVIIPELHSFPLAEGGDALTMVGSGHVRGKLVVVPL